MNKHEKKKLDIPTKLQTLNPKQIMNKHEENNFTIPTNLELRAEQTRKEEIQHYHKVINLKLWTMMSKLEEKTLDVLTNNEQTWKEKVQCSKNLKPSEQTMNKHL